MVRSAIRRWRRRPSELGCLSALAPECRRMTRVLTFAAGLAVVIATGVVYGAWTQRWQRSADLEARAAKLRDLPDRRRPLEVDAGRNRTRGFVHGRRRGVVGAALHRRAHRDAAAGDPADAAGPDPSASTGRRPATPAAGYGLVAAAGSVHASVGRRDEPSGRVLGRRLPSAGSRRAGAADLLLVVRRRGLARPDNPRWTFARLPALYKLYVIRDKDGRGERLDDDPAADFLRVLLPGLSRSLSEP